MFSESTFEINPQLIEYLSSKVHPDKVELYKNIFSVFSKINDCSFFINKYDCNRIEDHLLDLCLKDSEDVNAIECIDMFLKDLIVQNLKKEYVLLDMDSPLNIIVKILDNYVSLFYIEEGLKHYVVNMCQIDGVNDGIDPETTFCFILEMIENFDNFTEVRSTVINVDTILFSHIVEALDDEPNDELLDVSDLQYLDDLNRLMYYFNIDNLVSSNMKYDSYFKKICKNNTLNKDIEELISTLGEYSLEDDVTTEDKIVYVLLTLICSKDSFKLDKSNIPSILQNYQIFETIQERSSPIYVDKIISLFEKCRK